MLKAAGLEASWYASRKSDGTTQITINSVEVAGVSDIRRAVANVRFDAANHADTKTLDVEFLREGAEWKPAATTQAGTYSSIRADRTHPLALVVALSPLSIIPAVLVLHTPRPRPTGLAFLVGWLSDLRP